MREQLSHQLGWMLHFKRFQRIFVQLALLPQGTTLPWTKTSHYGPLSLWGLKFRIFTIAGDPFLMISILDLPQIQAPYSLWHRGWQETKHLKIGQGIFKFLTEFFYSKHGGLPHQSAVDCHSVSKAILCCLSVMDSCISIVACRCNYFTMPNYTLHQQSWERVYWFYFVCPSIHL